MALTNDEKLKNFEYEAMTDAQRVCDEIKATTKQELQDKIDAGEKQILADIYEFMQDTIGKIRKEKSLEISRAGIDYRHEYLRYSDTMFVGIFEKVDERLKMFLASDEYFKYLKTSCINIIDKLGEKINILYKPGDEDLIIKLKSQINSEDVNFIPDEDIKVGGLRFRDIEKNILINDILDEKIARSKEMLTASIGLILKKANEIN